MKLLSTMLLMMLTLSPVPAVKGRAAISPTSAIVNGEAYAVVQQLDAWYVSPDDDTFTVLKAAEWYNVTWLMAHDYLAGDAIAALEIGDTVTVTLYGKTVQYTVTSIRIYEPSDVPFSTLTMEPGLVMQTCYGNDRLIVEGSVD